MLALALAVAFAASPNLDESKRLYQVGESEYEHGHFQVALDDFQRAYQAVELPALLNNIAQCQRQLGLFQEAIATYEKYLATNPSEENRDQALEHLAEVRAKLAERSHAPAPVVMVLPAAATEASPVQPAKHGHGLAYALGGIAVAGLVAGVVGATLWIDAGGTSPQQTSGKISEANIGVDLSVIGALVLLGCGTGAAVTW
jgi:tetratricopeptide (TPR) repeat protein